MKKTLLISRSASSLIGSSTTQRFYQSNSYKLKSRISHQIDKIFIENNGSEYSKTEQASIVIPFRSDRPEIEIYENNHLVRTFKIDPLLSNPNLNGQYLHASVTVLPNSGVMMDGFVSSLQDSYPDPNDRHVEAIRFQPFFLKKEKNEELIGRGLFRRGLHFAGWTTPTSVRCVCSCDHCHESFTLEHFHSGFMFADYFYSKDGKETLIVTAETLGKTPQEMDQNLRESGWEDFAYYNSLRCPHCSAPFIDFEKFKEQREEEYYGNRHINTNSKHWKNLH